MNMNNILVERSLS